MGCQQVAGISQHEYLATSGDGSDAGAPGDITVLPLTSCTDYCDDVMASCADELSAYPSMEACLGVCAALPAGSSADDLTSNSVACRHEQARLAAQTGELAFYCPRAGIGGGVAGSTCGTRCEAYCSLMQEVCPDLVPGDCVNKCAALPDDGTYPRAYQGDTLQCRLAHLAAATLQPAAHCPHTAFDPSQVKSPCNLGDTEAPRCADFCRLVMVACTGEHAVYASEQECMTACASFPAGTAADTQGATLGCRRYHAYAAFADPSQCVNAGPDGGTTCRTAAPHD